MEGGTRCGRVFVWSTSDASPWGGGALEQRHLRQRGLEAASPDDLDGADCWKLGAKEREGKGGII